MPAILIALAIASLLVGGAVGYALRESEQDSEQPTTADEKNFEAFKRLMDECRKNENVEKWAGTKKP